MPTSVTGVRQVDKRLVIQPPIQWILGFVPWRKIGRGVKLTAQLDLMLKLGICGATHLLPLHAFRTRLYNIQTSGNIPEKSIQHSEQGESLKSRTLPSSKALLKYSVSTARKFKTEHISCNHQEVKHFQENDRCLLPDSHQHTAHCRSKDQLVTIKPTGSNIRIICFNCVNTKINLNCLIRTAQLNTLPGNKQNRLMFE